jgi:hypothetical protein
MTCSLHFALFKTFFNTFGHLRAEGYVLMPARKSAGTAAPQNAPGVFPEPEMRLSIFARCRERTWKNVVEERGS